MSDTMKEKELAVAVDYETFYDTNADYSLGKMSTDAYCRDDRFDAYLVAICGSEIFDASLAADAPTKDGDVFRALADGRQLYIGRPERFPSWDALAGRTLLAHNASFDSVVTEELVQRKLLPESLSHAKWQCTADLTAYLLVRRNLKDAMKYLFGKDISKEVRSRMDGRHDWELTDAERRQLVEYGGSDAVECHDLWLRYSDQWPEVERLISGQNRNAVRRGVRVDREYAEAALKELRSYQSRIMCDIPWTSEINPKTKEFYKVGSLPALREAVARLGVKPPKSFKKDDPGFLEWLENHDDIPFIKARQTAVALAMHIARIEGILKSLDESDSSHPSFLYFGAHTGRFSGKSDTGGVNINLLNMPRKPVFHGDENVFDGKGVDIRGMYVPKPGHKFVVYDYSQIESRFSLWLVGDTHMAETIAQEGNLYQANAVAMGWCEPGDKIKKTKPDLYRLAKAATLGLGYSMGAAKFVDSCKSQGLDLPSVPVSEWPEMDRRMQFLLRNVLRVKGDPFSEQNRHKVGQFVRSMQIVEDWRRANHRIVEQWKYYESVFKQRVAAGKDTVAFRLPSGRIKRYYSPHLVKEETTEVDEHGVEHPSFRIKMCATLVRGDAPKTLTGGKIMENIVQASCRDIMTYGCVEIEETHPNWEFKFSVYDEVVFEVPDEDCELARREVPRIMTGGSRIADWTKGLLLEVEGDVVERYCK